MEREAIKKYQKGGGVDATDSDSNIRVSILAQKIGEEGRELISAENYKSITDQLFSAKKLISV